MDREWNAAAGVSSWRAIRVEPGVTTCMQEISDSVPGVTLYGLKNRLKGEESLKRKLATARWENPDISAYGAVGDMKDVIRYTVLAPDSSYCSTVERAVGTLRERGGTCVKWKNTWSGDGYKGINAFWKEGGGQIFEVQFHTRSSFETKTAAHELYERQRVTRDAAEQERLQLEMNQLFAAVPVPGGAGEVSP